MAMQDPARMPLALEDQIRYIRAELKRLMIEAASEQEIVAMSSVLVTLETVWSQDQDRQENTP